MTDSAAGGPDQGFGPEYPVNYGPPDAPPYGPAPQYPPQYLPPPAAGYAYPPSAPGYAYPAPVVVQQAPSNGLGTAGFVTGLLGLIFCWVPYIGLILGILGIVLGGVGISSGRRRGAGTGLAVAGLVLGIISLVPAIIIIAAVASST